MKATSKFLRTVALSALAGAMLLPSVASAQRARGYAAAKSFRKNVHRLSGGSSFDAAAAVAHRNKLERISQNHERTIDRNGHPSFSDKLTSLREKFNRGHNRISQWKDGAAQRLKEYKKAFKEHQLARKTRKHALPTSLASRFGAKRSLTAQHENRLDRMSAFARKSYVALARMQVANPLKSFAARLRPKATVAKFRSKTSRRPASQRAFAVSGKGWSHATKTFFQRVQRVSERTAQKNTASAFTTRVQQHTRNGADLKLVKYALLLGENVSSVVKRSYRAALDAAQKTAEMCNGALCQTGSSLTPQTAAAN